MNPVIRSIDQVIISVDLIRWYELGYKLGVMGADLEVTGGLASLPDRVDAMTRGYKRGVAEREARKLQERSEQ